jgi:hypothetical protein
MVTPTQFRAKAAEYTELVKAAKTPDEAREFQKLEQSFTTLANNEQWLSDNHDQTIRAPQLDAAGGVTSAPEAEQDSRDQAAAVYRASRKKNANETRGILRSRTKAYKVIASNEEWLSGEVDRITGARTTGRQAPDQK